MRRVGKEALYPRVRQGERLKQRDNRARRKADFTWECDHSGMRYCCKTPCGHLVCDCGLAWDEGAEK